jgi:hypothetical protein
MALTLVIAGWFTKQNSLFDLKIHQPYFTVTVSSSAPDTT